MGKAYTILALDLGTNMGWCLGEDSVIVASAVEVFGAKDAHPGHRFLKFQNWLLQFNGVNEIYYEDVPRYVSKNNARVYCGFLAVLQIYSLATGTRLTCMKANSVKKEFTGNGRAEKADMCEAALKLGWANGEYGGSLNHDEADAIGIFYAIEKRRGNEVRFTPLN